MATNQPGDNLKPKIQQELLNNLRVRGNLSTGDIHQTINSYFSSQPPHQQELTIEMFSNEAEGVGTLADNVYKWVFEAGTPPVHILLRDYARGVIEATAPRGILPTHVDIERSRPPYQSAWPLEVPAKEELAPYGKTIENMDDREWARWHLYNSVMGFEDFTR